MERDPNTTIRFVFIKSKIKHLSFSFARAFSFCVSVPSKAYPMSILTSFGIRGIIRSGPILLGAVSRCFRSTLCKKKKKKKKNKSDIHKTKQPIRLIQHYPSNSVPFVAVVDVREKCYNYAAHTEKCRGLSWIL